MQHYNTKSLQLYNTTYILKTSFNQPNFCKQQTHSQVTSSMLVSVFKSWHCLNWTNKLRIHITPNPFKHQTHFKPQIKAHAYSKLITTAPRQLQYLCLSPVIFLTKKNKFFNFPHLILYNIKPTESHRQMHMHPVSLLIIIAPPQLQATVQATLQYLTNLIAMMGSQLKEFRSTPVLAKTSFHPQLRLRPITEIPAVSILKVKVKIQGRW